MKSRKKTKILIQWFEVMPDGRPVIQTRKYTDDSKAEAFVDKLGERGIKQCQKRTTEQIDFETTQLSFEI